MKNLKKTGLLLCLAGGLFYCTPKPSPAISETLQGPALGLCINKEELFEASTKDLSNTGSFLQIKVIYEGDIDRNKDVQLDQDQFVNRINYLYPEANASGICMIDWEGKMMDALKKFPEEHEKFQTTLKEVIKTVQLAKSTRPNVKWGMYGLPLRKYYKRDEAWQNNAKKLKPLFQEVDILFPSIYDFYEGDTQKDRDYVSDNVQLALQFGSELNKTVFPVMWHRWHVSNKKHPYGLIPLSEFLGMVGAAYEANVDGKTIDGIAWWGIESDAYFRNHKKVPALIEEIGDQPISEYQKQLIQEYGKATLGEMVRLENTATRVQK